MIDLTDVSLSFGGVRVLEGVDLRVDRGEFVALVGPNGAGKTTLLRTINGVLDPEAGAVSVDGEPLAQQSAREISRTLATVPQDTHVGFAFSAEQVVEMGRTPHRSRLDWNDEADPVDAALERTETTHLRDRGIDDLSGGERQRVLLARALAQEPDALLLDEPTANLDINHQVRMLGLVKDLVAEGRAALAAIHDLDLAARFCDRLLLLHEGEICARGPPETVLNDPRLGDAFATTSAVTRNSITGTPTVAAFADRPDREMTVHVAGGGESGLTAVRTLWRAGFDVTAGVVPEGDVTDSLAASLNLKTVTAPPFGPVPEAAERDAARLASEADAVVVTDGPGNEAISDSVDPDQQVHAALAGSSPAGARVDGGRPDVAETPGALVAAMENRSR